ncbi:MAG: polyphosphate kinase 2 family protein [Candidatus Bathyarchaeia archaeon]|jgi:PPK2 family polyphosphate:nucleotide phosphotransferase
MSLERTLLVRPGKNFRLRDHDPDDTLGYRNDGQTQAALKKHLERLDKLQYLLYASKKCALLIVLQAVDSGGKDGTIRHVMSGVNPQGCRVTSFKKPTPEEAAHDFLWRIHKAVPERGEIGIFNRSHYEDVLVVRVHKLVPESVWSRRYKEINRFEKILVENNVKILKFHLHISREEQLKRFKQRLEDPAKYWELSPADFQERRYWNRYMTAYEDVLKFCSTEWAPWYLIPANHKWFRNLAVSQIIVETLEGLNMKFPKPAFDVSKYRRK